MTLRERCEKAWNVWARDKYMANAPNEMVSEIITDMVEAFAREIRNEALEKAASLVYDRDGFCVDDEMVRDIRALKDKE